MIATRFSGHHSELRRRVPCSTRIQRRATSSGVSLRRSNYRPRDSRSYPGKMDGVGLETGLKESSFMLSTCLIVLASFWSSAAGADAPVVLENEHLLVEFSARDGSITRLRNKQQGLELISIVPGARQPWAMLLAPAELVSDFEAFRIVPPGTGPAHQVTLEWETRHRIFGPRRGPPGAGLG